MRDFFKEKGELIKIISIGVLYLAAILVFHFVDCNVWIERGIYIALYLAVGYEVVIHAFKEFKEEPFNEEFLMLLASVGAFALGDFAEAVAVMFFFSVGELFEDYADERSERAIETLVGMMSKTATVVKDGGFVCVDVSRIQVGDRLMVKAGERVAADGLLESEEGFFDTSMITGESNPERITKGEAVRSGYTVVGAPVTISASARAEESSAAKIISLIKDAQDKKAKSEKFITHFAKIYTPIVIGLALIVAFLPPIFGAELSVWVGRALNLLVISCPCALVVSVPIAFFVGIGNAFSKGIIVKGSATLEKTGRISVYAFDKTGTLTEGKFNVKSIMTDGDENEILRLAASIESFSSHPIAKAITRACEDKGLKLSDVENVSEIAGNGLIGELNGEKLLVGSRAFLEKNGVVAERAETGDTVVYLAYGDILGAIVIGDKIKVGAKELVSELNAKKKSTAILTGDNGPCAESYAKEIGVGEYYAELSPSDKVERVETLKRNGEVLFVGDGINDAPVLSCADVSVAFGSGSDVAADCADVVIVGDDIRKISELRKIAKRTTAVAYANIIGSIAVKICLFALSIVGSLPLWLAIFGDVGVMVLATLNSFALGLKSKAAK